MNKENPYQLKFTDYNISELKKILRYIIPKCNSIPILNKNSTTEEILDAVNFIEMQEKYNQKINRTE